MPDTMTMERIAETRGAPVYDADGDKIGNVEEIFYDVQTREPEWVGIRAGFFDTKLLLVPLESAQLSGLGLRVPFAKDHVMDAPDTDDDVISEQTEQELHAYYQLAGQPTGKSKSRRSSKQKVTRSEEELKVGERTVEARGVRLRKWVESEDVDVELRRATARVTRKPIDKPVHVDLSQGEIEVPLRRGAVTQNQVFAKERVGVPKDVHDGQQDRER